MKYKVRVEIKVASTELAWIDVEAADRQQAKKLACAVYKDNPLDCDAYVSDDVVERIDLDSIDDWEVEEVIDE